MQIEGKQTNKLIACAAIGEFNAWMTSNIIYTTTVYTTVTEGNNTSFIINH